MWLLFMWRSYKNNTENKTVATLSTKLLSPSIRQEGASVSLFGLKTYLSAIRVSKLGNIHNRLSKLIEKPFLINHQLLLKCILDMSACFLTTIICFPVTHMLVITNTLYMYMHIYLFCLKMAVKFHIKILLKWCLGYNWLCKI